MKNDKNQILKREPIINAMVFKSVLQKKGGLSRKNDEGKQSAVFLRSRLPDKSLKVVDTLAIHANKSISTEH